MGVDLTIRNIDEEAYQRLRTWAAHQGLEIGEALSRLVLQHAHLPQNQKSKVSMWKLKPTSWGPGSERTSQQIDEIVYDESQQ